MGGTTSKTSYEQVVDISVNAAMSTTQTCSSAATSEQSIQLQNIKGDVILKDVTMTQDTQVNLECLMKADKQAEMRQLMSTALAQFAESKGPAILSMFGKTKAEAEARIKASFSNSVSLSDAQNATAFITQKQSIAGANIGGSFVVKGLTMEQSAKLVLKSVLTSTQYNATLSDVAAKIDQATKAQSENPLNFITDIFKNMTWTTAAIMGGIVLAIILVIAAPFILISIAAKSGGAALSTMGGSAAAAVILG